MHHTMHVLDVRIRLYKGPEITDFKPLCRLVCKFFENNSLVRLFFLDTFRRSRSVSVSLYVSPSLSLPLCLSLSLCPLNTQLEQIILLRKAKSGAEFRFRCQIYDRSRTLS